MASRRSLYHAVCLASSAKEVIKGSLSTGCESFNLWVETSTLTRPILSQYQWFYDPEWEKSKKLSDDLRAKAKPKSPKGKQSHKKSVRHYSTTVKRKQDLLHDVC